MEGIQRGIRRTTLDDDAMAVDEEKYVAPAVLAKQKAVAAWVST